MKNIFLKPSDILFVTVIVFFFSTSSIFASTASSTTIFLHVETSTTTAYTGNLTVTPCDSPSASSTTTGYCALNQIASSTIWSAWGDDMFLDTVQGQGNDYTNNYYWAWFSNNEYGQTALNKHSLSEGEYLVVTITKMPLKIETSSTTLSVFEFGLDSSWNPVWIASVGSTLIQGTTTTYAHKDGFLDSRPVANIVPPQTTTPTNESQEQETTYRDHSRSSAGGGGQITTSSPTPTPFVPIADADKAIQFLVSLQKADGSFGSSLYTDWAALAFSTQPSLEAYKKIVEYERATNPSFSRTTDYERHAMALLALGINPHTGTKVSYIDPIVRAYDGIQIGDPELVNDDMFALFPLIHTGYTSSDSIIQNITAYIISKQKPDGSWDTSTDMTAAGIQALSLVPSERGVSHALDQAKEFLLSAQGLDGGFGSSYTTSWVIQAIYALDESPRDWIKNGKSPLDSLARTQESDGGFERMSAGNDTRTWATAYALPALSGTPWTKLLHTYPKPESISITTTEYIPSPTPLVVQPIIATTTIVHSTSTPATTSPITITSAPVQPKKIEVKPTLQKPNLLIPTATTTLATTTQQATTSGMTIPRNTASVGMLDMGSIFKRVITFCLNLFKP